jgi:signal transduction histidine kinase/GAF domain-containing protein
MLHRLNRELRAISSCNQTLLRAVDEQTLLNDVCRIICDEAGYRLAWVGYAEHDDAKTVRPVAWAGFDSGYIANARLSWSDDTERGRGPAGKAIRSGEIIYVQDSATDPQMAPWRESALQRSYRSGVALPLEDESAKVFGVLLIYSSEPNAITPDEIRLMEELSHDLAFGIVALRTRAERKRIEDIRQARLRLLEFANSHSMDELLTATLDEIEALTGSTIGFYHFLGSDQKTLSLQNWSTNTLKNMCTAAGKGSHYAIAQAGVWVDCVGERRPVIHNDYASLPHRKGMPEGHAPVIREVVVPIFRGNLIKAIIGVGNKPTNYNGSDIEIVSQLGDLSWDVAERKRAEETLRDKTRVTNMLLDALPCVALLMRPHTWEIVASNEAAVKVGAVPGARCFETWWQRETPCPWCLAPEVWATNEPRHLEIEAGGTIWDTYWIPMTEDLYLHYAFDITKLRQAEQQAKARQAELMHVSRLSTLGEMASSLAHELNQPLSAILSYASASRRLIRPRNTDVARLRGDLDQVILQTKRAGEIIKRVRAFAQRRPPHVRPTDANGIVREVLAFVRSDVVHKEVDVILELCRDLPQVLADPIQLEQVLLNLMRNAIEAMEPMKPQERQLTIRTSTPAPGTVTVAVSDTGVGLHPEMVSRIFEPFFTTKAEGLGMGLSIARSIVEMHRGQLWVEPGRERGCTFVFTLPAAPDDPTAPGSGGGMQTEKTTRIIEPSDHGSIRDTTQCTL